MAFSTARIALQLPSNVRFASTALSKPHENLRSFFIAANKQLVKDGWWHKTTLAASVTASSLATPEGQTIINMLNNSYLGMHKHPRVVGAAINAIDKYNAIGTGAARKLYSFDLHEETEKTIAAFHGTEDAVLYSSLFICNGFLTSFLTEDDVVLSDANNHSSIIYGIRLTGCKKYVYRNLDMEDLEKKLQEVSKTKHRLKFIFTDGVFSMEGTIAPIIKMRELADKYNAVIINDDCHAIGIMGKTGKGTDEFLGVKNYSDILLNSTGKCMSAANGGYITGTKEMCDLLRNTHRHYTMSTSSNIPDVAAINESFKVLQDEPELLTRLQDKIHYFKNGLLAEGFDITGVMETGVTSIITGSEADAVDMYHELIDRGILCIGVRFPGVARGHARIRFTINVDHTKEQLDYVVENLVRMREERGGTMEVFGDALTMIKGNPSKKMIKGELHLYKDDYLK